MSKADVISIHYGDRVRGSQGFAYAGLTGTVVSDLAPKRIGHDYYVKVRWDVFADKRNHITPCRVDILDVVSR